MRQKIPNEKVVEKTIAFLRGLKLFCDGTSGIPTITALHEHYNVSRSTGSACKKLEIIKQTETGMVWMANEPSRQIALMVLNLNLERSPNVMKSVPIPEFASLIDQFKDIGDKLGTYITQNERSLKTAKNSTHQSGETLFSKDQQYFDLVKSIAMGLYANPATDLMPYQSINQMAVDAAKDLMDKAFTNGTN